MREFYFQGALPLQAGKLTDREAPTVQRGGLLDAPYFELPGKLPFARREVTLLPFSKEAGRWINLPDEGEFAC
jgi:hypothetical protein